MAHIECWHMLQAKNSCRSCWPKSHWPLSTTVRCPLSKHKMVSTCQSFMHVVQFEERVRKRWEPIRAFYDCLGSMRAHPGFVMRLSLLGQTQISYITNSWALASKDRVCVSTGRWPQRESTQTEWPVLPLTVMGVVLSQRRWPLHELLIVSDYAGLRSARVPLIHKFFLSKTKNGKKEEVSGPRDKL